MGIRLCVQPISRRSSVERLMLARLLRFGGFSRAVGYSILLRVCQSGAGLLSLSFIGVYFPREVQGYYYTFASLVALQSFAELGLTVVITNAASHEWSKLRLGESGTIEGDPHALSRLVSLGRFVVKWYAAAAGLFFLLAGGGGYWFLGRAAGGNVDWHGPWLVHIACSSVFMWCVPFLSLLEGCDQVAEVARFRLVQSIFTNGFFLLAVRAGASLWAAPVMSSTSALFCVWYLLVTRRRFFGPFFKPPTMDGINWRLEIWPMQWRLASQAVLAYFMFSLFTPVVFYYRGPVEAGQMGMSFQLITALQTVASIWVATKVPRYGILVARRDFDLLDSEWKKAGLLSIGVMIAGVIGLLGALYIANLVRPGTAARVVAPTAFMMLAVGALCSVAAQNFALYLRAHMKEVLMASSFASASAMGILVWQLGSHYGSMGVSAAYLVVMAGVSFPTVFLIWRKARKEWHA